MNIWINEYGQVQDCEIGICIGNTAQVRVLASRLVTTHTFDYIFVYVFTRFFTHLLLDEIAYLLVIICWSMRVHRSFDTQSLTAKRTHTYLAYLCMYLFIYWLNYLLSVYWFVCLHVVVVCMLFIYLFCLHVVHLPIHSLIHHASIHWFVHVHVPGVRAYTNVLACLFIVSFIYRSRMLIHSFIELLFSLFLNLFVVHACWSIALICWFIDPLICARARESLVITHTFKLIDG